MITTCLHYSQTIDKFNNGFTIEDVELRLKRHLINHKGFASRARDWQMIYTENFSSKTAAMKSEKQLKAWKNNSRINDLISRSLNE
jgi:putative endonuclease